MNIKSLKVSGTGNNFIEINNVFTYSERQTCLLFDQSDFFKVSAARKDFH